MMAKRSKNQMNEQENKKLDFFAFLCILIVIVSEKQ